MSLPCNPPIYALLHTLKFRLFPFRSPLLRESNLFIFLRLLRCFTSAGTHTRAFNRVHNMGLPCWVSPFGNLRITGCYTPPRSLSQLRYVLHRHVVSRHPSYALKRSHACDSITNHITPRPRYISTSEVEV